MAEEERGRKEGRVTRSGGGEHKIWKDMVGAGPMGGGREAGGTKRERRREQGKWEEKDGRGSSPRRQTSLVIKVTKISIFHAYSPSFIPALGRIIAYWMKFFFQLFRPHPVLRPSTAAPTLKAPLRGSHLS